MVGYYIGYSKTKVGYRVLLGNTVVTSVHVLFDKSIPEWSADYFCELDKATVKCDSEERQVSDFDWLVGQHHMDGEPLYKTTRVIVRRGLIVGFRVLITAGKQQIEDKTPIHIADIQTMTEEFLQRLQKKPCDHYGGTGGDALTAGMVVMLQRPEPEVSSEKGMSPSAESTRRSPGDGTKRVRTQRVLTNVATLGEIHSVDVDTVTPCLSNVDNSLLTDSATYSERETYQELLDCPEHQEWRVARANERRALQERSVMKVVPTLAGVAVRLQTQVQ